MSKPALMALGGLATVSTLSVIGLVIWLFAFDGQGHAGWWLPDTSAVAAASKSASRTATKTATKTVWVDAEPTATADWEYVSSENWVEVEDTAGQDDSAEQTDDATNDVDDAGDDAGDWQEWDDAEEGVDDSDDDEETVDDSDDTEVASSGGDAGSADSDGLDSGACNREKRGVQSYPRREERGGGRVQEELVKGALRAGFEGGVGVRPGRVRGDD